MEEQFSDTHKESSQLGSQPKGLDGCYGHQLQIVIMVEVQRMGGGGRRIERDSLSKQHTFCDAIAGFLAK